MKRTYTIPVGNMRPSKKKWWQIWRKKEDSAEETLAEMISNYSGNINFKPVYRKNSIHRIYNIEPIPLTFAKDYWFPNR